MEPLEIIGITNCKERISRNDLDEKIPGISQLQMQKDVPVVTESSPNVVPDLKESKNISEIMKTEMF